MSGLPLDSIVIAILIERLGGKVTITDAEMLLFDRDARLVEYRDGLADALVVEVRRPPVTVAGEVVTAGPLALTAE